MWGQLGMQELKSIRHFSSIDSLRWMCRVTYTDIIMEGVASGYGKGSLSYSVIDCKTPQCFPSKTVNLQYLEIT